MSTKAADDFESIARHLKELEAERQLALTGSSAPVTEKVGEYAVGRPGTAAEDLCGYGPMWAVFGDTYFREGPDGRVHSYPLYPEQPQIT